MKTLILAAIRCSLIFIVPTVTYAISAEWGLDPISGDWNTAANWTPMGIPNAPADTATFARSNTTSVFISANTEVDGITFTPAAASSYTITASPGFKLTLSGTGITNDSGITQNFVTAVDGAGNAGEIRFTHSATAGSSTVFTNNGAAIPFAEATFTSFSGNSTAGSGTFTNNGGTLVAGARGGNTAFFGQSTAGSGTFTNNAAAVAGAFGGGTFFSGQSTAGSGTFTNNGGAGAFNSGVTAFFGNSTAGLGTFINNGGALVPGSTSFRGDSSAAGGTFINDGGFTEFNDRSNAGVGTFTNNGAAAGCCHGFTTFINTSSAEGGTFINNGGAAPGVLGGYTSFQNSSTAHFSTLIANGGTDGGQGGQVLFEDASEGGTSQIEVFGNGNLDISLHNTPGVTIGSIEGDGNVFLGANNLTVGRTT